ncbi:hypothetical protein PHJA_001244900 [Phtheirospermum japonicum]|uniref:Hyaluronan/mRNA-binding protein domain-containing protein n=1 Tax=Phtheirospermum japonicum TaxID=374723 RepID=A0A830BX63_9LAMI|nr:hypothetical protein PHJA_001244900 [Phtheirospermum japonicum]
MATTNQFDLLGDDDAEDPSLLIAALQQKTEPKKAAAPSSKAAAGGTKPAAPGKLPSKPTPPAQAVKEGKLDSARGGGRGGGRGYGYGRDRGAGGGSYRDSSYNENSYGNREFSAAQGTYEADAGKPYERRGGSGGPRDPARGSRRGGYSNGGDFREGDRERPRRQFDRRSGSVQGNEMKREGSGQGNWGTETDELSQITEGGVVEVEKDLNAEKPQSAEEIAAAEADKEAARKAAEEKEIEDKQMTLEEYEKVLEEKRKALQALKTEGRKVDAKEFESMQPLSSKKANHDIFIKLGSEKDKKLVEKEEKAKKSVSINEFLKPADGERYNRGGRGRGRGGFRGGYGGGGSETSNARALVIEDPVEFPSLGGK